jgi:deoxyribonucleoside regulator
VPRPEKVPTAVEMLTAATLFYQDGQRKKEIAGVLHTDIRSVTKILAHAKASGIVRIQVQGTTASDLEQRIRAKFGHLQKVLIVPGPRISTWERYAEIVPRFGVLAADYFNELVEHQPQGTPLNIGVTGGQELLEFAQAVSHLRREDVHIQVSALVGSGRLRGTASPLLPIVTASILWNRCGSLPDHCQYATVSPYDPKTRRPGPAARKAVKIEIGKVEKNQTVREVVEAMDILDVVFAGVGVVNPSGVGPEVTNRISMTGLLQNVVTPRQLAEEGAVGDLAYCPFDESGNTKPEWRFFMTAGHYSFFNRKKPEHYWGIDFYKRMVATPGKKVVAIGGPYHLRAIKIMLRAKICNVLITDEATAREIADSDQ